MRFKAVITKQNLALFSGVLQSLERICANAAVLLTPTTIRIALISENADLPKSYVELFQRCLFLEYRIESQSDNNLLFEISLSNLISALNSGKNCFQTLIKLVKRDNKPYLCVETKATDGLDVDITHDISIR